MRNPEPGYYFALPRLWNRLRSASSARSEMNWLEATLVGGAVHSLVYLFAAHLFLRGLGLGWQGALALPLALGVWLGWLAWLYLASLVIHCLRAVGWMRTWPDARAQSLLIGILTNLFALELCRAGSWLRAVGVVYLTLTLLNLLAAAALAMWTRHGTAAA